MVTTDGDGMIKEILVVALFLVAGVAVGLYMQGISITSLFTTGPEPLQSIVSQVRTLWTSIPTGLQGITLTAIPTAFMLFFAWSKSRAM